MISKLLLDSSILVEYAKQNKTELLDYLLGRSEVELYINSIVLSEYTYHWLANNGNKSPRSLQQSGQIGLLLAQGNIGIPLSAYTVLPVDDRIVPIYLNLMQTYNLLPNDALIIATAKLYGIPAVASFDTDFLPACEGESIRLIRAITDVA